MTCDGEPPRLRRTFEFASVMFSGTRGGPDDNGRAAWTCTDSRSPSITWMTTAWCTGARFVRRPGRRCGAGWPSTAPNGDGEFALEGCTGWRYCQRGAGRAAGLGVHLGDPAETAGVAGSQEARPRPTRADARFAAHVCWWRAGSRSRGSRPAHVLEIRTLGRLYCTLMDERRAWQQRIHAQLFHQGLFHRFGRCCQGAGREGVGRC